MPLYWLPVTYAPSVNSFELSTGCVVVLEQVLERVEVAERLFHPAGVVALARADALADHAVLDRVAVLVADHGHVVVAVDARGVERAGERLPEEHVRLRPAARAVGRRSTCSRCRGEPVMGARLRVTRSRRRCRAAPPPGHPAWATGRPW